MNNKNLLLLGGYGNVGRVVAPLLLQETSLQLIIAGRNFNKAVSFAGHLNTLFKGGRVTAVHADVSNAENLKHVFKGIDFVLVVSSTAVFTKEIAVAAIESGCDYMDIHFGPKVYTTLHSLADAMKNSGRCFITGGGFHPGLPAAVIRYAGQRFDKMETAIVGGMMSVNFREYDISKSTQVEFVEEVMEFNPLFYKNGEWKKINLMSTKDYIAIDFGGDFGVRQCSPMFFEELREIPLLFPTLTHCGFYMAGFNWVVDYVLFPFIFITLKLFPRAAVVPMSKLMVWGLKTFSKPPYGLVMKVKTAGLQNNTAKQMEIKLSHKDGSSFTAIPVVACILQYLNGSIKKPGLWLQANVVEPNRFVKDIERMGINVQIQELVNTKD